MDEFDVTIVGAGQAGIPLARSLANANRRVALIERKHVGGSCINFGCTPTKAALASARLVHLARRAGTFGIRVPVVQPDFPAVLARAASIAEHARDVLQQSFSGHDNPLLITGHARMVMRDNSGFRLAVGAAEFRTTHVVLDTGSTSRLPPIEGLQDIDYIDSENWLHHRTLPRALAMVGGGYIGLEMAQFYRRMGAEVTVIESGAQIVSQEDADVAQALQRVLEAEDIRFSLNTKVIQFQRKHDGVAITLDRNGRQEVLVVSDVFVAVGRQPNTADLGLQSAGLALADNGTVEVDRRLSTKIPGIWAVGDIRGGPMFTHTAWDDYRIIESQLAGNGSRTTDRIVPYAIFTDPSLGRVGLTERQARQTGKPVKVAHFDMANNGKATELGETAGFIKIVVDADNQRIVGAAVLSAEGAELVHIYVALMNADAPYTALENAIQIHPTLAEAIQSAVSSLR